ncbi:MAG TPA: signal peptidase I [Bryobacteraceae bacterium]|nr:signal peptidase I [Bryobacteraceae bacterium]
MPLIARIAAAVAFLVTAGSLLPAVRGQIFALPFALIPLLAGVGIVRRRAWDAWGFSLYTLAQLVPLAIVLARASSFATRPPGSLGAVTLALLLAPLFFFAGRSLAESEAPRGWAWPWIAVSVLTTVPLLFFQIFVIPSAAMENTLLAGDRIVVWRFPKHIPGRDEMVVFRFPIEPRQTFVQRVVGIPGDRLRISGRILYRNGMAVSEPWAVHEGALADPYRDNFPNTPATTMYNAQAEMLRKDVVDGEVVVPPGKYFVLGDNRANALDSRYWGFVDGTDVIGKPMLIYGSEEDEGNGRFRVRWDRLFRVL